MPLQRKVLPSECKTLPTVHHPIDRQVAFRHFKWPWFSNLRSGRCAHSAPLSNRGERIWHQGWRGAVRIEHPHFSNGVIVDEFLILHSTQIARPHDIRGVNVRRVVNPCYLLSGSI